MNIIFGGKFVAFQKEKALQKKVLVLKKKGATPKLASIVVGNDKGALFYQNLKKKKTEDAGAELSIVNFQFSTKKEDIFNKIKELNLDNSVHGIMIQLPLPENFSKSDRDEILNAISPEKDVDGMRDNSDFTAPVALAALEAVKHAEKYIPCKENPCKVVVVGAKGFEGKKIMKALDHEIIKAREYVKTKSINDKNKDRNSVINNQQSKINNYSVVGVDVETKDIKTETKDADVVVSVTGVADLIKPDMIKQGAALIDVGYPKGDIAKGCYKKASFVSPVPGGIGPLTIYYLIENLVNAVE